MKITKILAIIFAAVSVCLAAAGLAFMEWSSEGENYAVHNPLKVYGFLFGILMIVFYVIALTKKSKLAIIPLIGFVPAGIYFVKKIYEVFDVAGMTFNQSIIDVVSPTENFNVITLLLFVAFITCAIISIVKDNKFTKLFVVGYFALLILSTIKFLPEITMFSELKPITFLSYGMVAGYAAFMLFFIPCFSQAKEDKDQPTAEETTEQPVVEEDKE